MDYRIVTKPGFTIMGYTIRTSIHGGQNLQDIPAFWSRYMQGDVGLRLCDASVNHAEYGICDEFDAATGTFSYIIGVEPTEDAQAPEGAVVITKHYPEQTYAVFTTPRVTAEQFSPSIQQTWHYIYNEWLPASEYEHGNAIEFEYYDERCWQDRNELLEMDIYIPIKPKNM